MVGKFSRIQLVLFATNLVLRWIDWIKILKKFYLSLYMDLSEFDNDHLYDSRISDASHLEPKLY